MLAELVITNTNFEHRMGKCSMRMQTYTEIVGILDTLGIGSDDIRGRILLLGCYGMSEAPIIFTDPFAYRPHLRPSISEVIGVDIAHISDPERYPDHMHIYAGCDFEQYMGRLWNHQPFHAIFFLRAELLRTKVLSGFIPRVGRLLASDGFLVASGDSLESSEAMLQEESGLVLARREAMDQYGGMFGRAGGFHGDHTGYVWRRRDV